VLDGDPSVTDTPSTAPVVWRASPSSVETFLACPARWGFAKLPGGVREPGSDATEFGTEVHTEREKYLRAATDTLFPHVYDFPDTRAGVVARALSEYLPKGMPPYGYFEADHEYDAGDGIVLHGFPDMAWPDPRAGVAVTADYKTTGSMRYAKLDRDALFGHAQAPLYLLFNMRKWGFDKGRALWLYAERPPLVKPADGWPKVRVEQSDHTMSRDEATERVHLRMVPPAKQMLAAYTSGMTAAQAGELPKNLRNCRSYGRLCPYHATCNPKKDQHMDQASNAFLAGLGLGAGGAPPPAPEPTSPATAPPAPTTPAAPPAPTDAAPPGVAPAPPGVNPPEAAGKKGKGRATAPVGLTAADVDAIAEAVADKLALRLMRNVP
jgi:hypothetical protein